MADWVNPCGGTRWRQLGDGKIEVEGRGILYAEGYLRTYTQLAWQHYRTEILAAAAHHGLPPSYIVGILVVENGAGLRTRVSGAGTFNCPARCCYGLAQIMVCPYPVWKEAGMSRPEDVFDPRKAIDGLAKLIKARLAKGQGLPGAAAIYNSGGLCCPTAPTTGPTKPGGREWNEFLLCSAKPGGMSYPEVAIRANNYAVDALKVNAALGLGGALFTAVAAFAVVAGAGLLWISMQRR